MTKKKLYEVGDLVRMYDQVDEKEYFGIIQKIKKLPKEKNQIIDRGLSAFFVAFRERHNSI
jgi:hypothetical protein